MSATTEQYTAQEFRADLESLLQIAFEVASAEARLEAVAERMEKASKWERIQGLDTGRYIPLSASVTHALRTAQNDHSSSDVYGLEKCQDIQDAIDVLDFAIKRDHLDEVAS